MRAAARPAGRPRRSRRTPFGAYLALALIVTAVLWGVFAPGGKAAGDSQAAGNAQAIAAGKQLFSQGCQTCHGLAGQGVAGVAPPLIGVGAAAVDFQVSSGRMPLAAIGVQAQRHKPAYSQEQTDDLAAYVQSLGGGPQQSRITAADLAIASIVTGGELFRANCASCHNFAGAGNALDKGRFAPNLGTASANQIYEAMITGPESMPVFGNRQITPAQKVAIAKFVLGLQDTSENPGGAALGHLGPVPEGVVAFLIGIGGLVLATLFIGSRS